MLGVTGCRPRFHVAGLYASILFKAHCFISLLPIVALGVQGSFNEYFVIECRWDMLIGSCPVIYRALVGVVEVSRGYIPQN